MGRARSHLPYSRRYMNKSIHAVQYRQQILVAVHEPLLDVTLSYGEQPVDDRRKLLDLQYLYTMALSDFPNARLCKYALRYHCRHAVESVIYYPVEHFNQERKLLEHSTVPVLAESRSIWCMNDKTTAVALLRWVLGGGVKVFAVVGQEAERRGGIVGGKVRRRTI